jgi:NADH-quinone oxidoreductase subunit I
MSEKQPGLIADIATGALSIAKGLGVTIVNFFRPKVTIQYPKQRMKLPARSRGFLYQLREANGRLKCTACEACAKACPSLALVNIQPDEKKGKERRARSYEWEAMRCMYCNLCVEVCPFDAIEFRPDHGYALYDRLRGRFNLEELLEPVPAETRPGAVSSG